MEMSSPGSNYLGTLNDEYTIVKELDFGASSKVYEVLMNKTGETRAAKIFFDDCRIAFRKELEIFNSIANLNCPIRKFSHGNGYVSMEEYEGYNNYIILELGKGSILQFQQKLNKTFSEDTTIYLFYQFMKGVEELHQRGISHRDLKVENAILVGDNLSVKLCDFGSSKSFMNGNNQKIMFKKTTKVGSPFHYPPEILENNYYDGERSDIYCAGIALFSLVTRTFPFSEEATPKDPVYKLICDNQTEKFWKYIDKDNLLSPQFKDLFIKMVAYNPADRITMNQIFNHPYLERLRNPNKETLAYFRNKVLNELGNIEI